MGKTSQFSLPEFNKNSPYTGSTHFDFLGPDPHQIPTQPGSTDNLNSDGDLQENNQKFEITSPQSDPSSKKVLFGWILLNQGISKRNFYFAWAYVMYLGFVLISFGTLEPQYISQTFHVETENMGKTTATLYLVDYSIRLCCAMIWGPLIDKRGRKFVFTCGVLLVSLGYLLIPFTSFSLYPGYLIGKSVLSAGLISLSMLPFAADYVDNSTKGLMAGFNYGMGFVGGAVSGLLVKSCLWLDFSYKTIYWIHVPILFFAGLFLTTGVKGGNTYYRTPKGGAVVQIQDSTARWMEVKKAYKDIPWIVISNLFGVLGNTDFYIMTTGLTVWIKSLISPDQDPTKIATTFQIIFFGLAFFSTIVTALKIDKISHMKVIFPVLICATIGFTLIPFSNTPQSVLGYLFICIEGLSLPGVFVFSSYLSIRYNPPEIRGTLSGIGNCFCLIGAIMILSLGGFLHDHWRSDASFILYWCLLVLTLIVVTALYFTKIKKFYRAKRKNSDMIRLTIPESIRQ